MSKGSVRLDDVGKRYVKYDDVPLLLSSAIRFRPGGRRSELWAVRHVNFAVEPGETMGVIGRNGSGKSTMLRMLAGVTAPTEGVVTVRGRVAPLIAVGVGFHPELTGRENVYVNATVLGLKRREIDRLFDSIVAFAEIEEFIDTPVKFYSSGMFVRLGFSVAVAARPDVLLVDEVLAVGDAAFQQKCFERMEEIRKEGTSVLVVSHNLNAIRILCERTLVLHNGVEKFVGPSDDAISLYYELLAVPADESSAEAGTGAAMEATSFTMRGEDGEKTNHVRYGEEVTFEMEVEYLKPVSDPVYSLVLSNEKGQLVYSDFERDYEGRTFDAGDRARYEATFKALLPTGAYQVRSLIRCDIGEDVYRAGRFLSFFVSGRSRVRGLADLEASFRMHRNGEGREHGS